MNYVRDNPIQAGNGYRHTYFIQSRNRATHNGEYPTLFEQLDEHAPYGLKQTYSKDQHYPSATISCGHVITKPSTVERSLWQVRSDQADETGGYWGREVYTTIATHVIIIEMTEDNNDVHRPYEGVKVTVGGKKWAKTDTAVTTYNPYSREETGGVEVESETSVEHTFKYEDSFGAVGAGRDDIIVTSPTGAPLSIQYPEDKDEFVVNKTTIEREFESEAVRYYDTSTGQWVEYTLWNISKLTVTEESIRLDYGGWNWQYSEHSMPTDIQPSNFRIEFMG